MFTLACRRSPQACALPSSPLDIAKIQHLRAFSKHPAVGRSLPVTNRKKSSLLVTFFAGKRWFSRFFFVTLQYVQQQQDTMTTTPTATPLRSYGRMELAQLYFPNICGRAAWRKFKDFVADDPALSPLLATGHRTFMPAEVDRIFQALGRPL